MTGIAMRERMDMPEGWQYTTIGDVTEKFLNGGTPSTKNPEYWEGNIPWTTSSPMTSFYLDRGEYTISKEGLEKSASNLIPKNNVLISTRVGVGKVAINRIDVAINQDLTGLILDKTRITPEFFVWTLLSKEYNQKLKGMSRGTTIKGLIRSELERFTIPIPPLPEQRRIATLLSTVDDAIQRSHQAAAETERFKAGVMQELMTKGIGHTEFREDPDVGWVPKEWDTIKIGQYIEFLTGYAFKSELFSEETTGIKLVRGDNVTVGELRWGDKTRYWKEVTPDLTKYLLEENDVLISMDGSLVGKNYAKVQKSDLPLLLVQRVARLRASEILNQDYLYHSISSSNFSRYVDSVKTVSAIPHISPNDIKNYKIPLPSLPEQQKIATLLFAIDRKHSLQRQRTAHYEHLKQGLMNELLTGRRRVKVT